MRNMNLISCRVSWLTVLVLLLVVVGIHRRTQAQDVQIAQQGGPYYVAEPMVIQVQISGVQSEQDVDCRLAQPQLPPGVTVDGPQIGQSKSTFSQIINGRISTRETVSFKYNFEVTADRPGAVIIGPFVVKIDSETQELKEVEIEFEELAEDPQLKLELSLPRQKIYVGEQVPVAIRWLFAGDRNGLNHAFSNLQIRSPLFEQFEFQDSAPTTRIALALVTAAGVVEVDAQVEQTQRDGMDYVMLSGQRMLAPTTPGTYVDIPASCRTQRVTRWGRGMFGDPRPLEIRPALARAKPLTFQVLPIPTQDRPASFSGAVGNGFSIDVAANRSVVRVGDPIALDIKLSGSGDLQRVSLPKLASSLDENLFQLPAEVPVGTVVGNAKQFKVNVRVKQETVDQLPAIELAWFDPAQEKFVTAQSKPIALQVNAAQIVSAADVISAADNRGDGSSSETVRSAGPAKQQSSALLSFMGANLAVQQHVPSLLVTPRLFSSQSWIIPLLYVFGIAAIVVAVGCGRLRKLSPGQTQHQKLLRQARAEVRQAEGQPPREATHRIATALRQLIAAWPEGNRSAAEQIIAECEQLGYSPNDQDIAARKTELVARASQAIENFSGK